MPPKSTGHPVSVDETTLTKTGSEISIKADGVGEDELDITTTKGDILGFSTKPARLPVGSDDEVLTSDSSETTGLKWGTPQLNFNVDVSTTNATQYDTGSLTYVEQLTVTFTPTTSNNIILAIKTQADLQNSTGGITADSKFFISDGTNKLEISRLEKAGTGFVTQTDTVAVNEAIAVETGSARPMTQQANYTLSMDLKTTSGGTTASIKNIIWTVIYLDNGVLTTASGKFS